MSKTFKPLAPYKHDGQTLHPKLAYALPPGMGASLAAMGFGAVVDEPADIDLTHIVWDAATKPQSGAVTPAPIQHPQA